MEALFALGGVLVGWLLAQGGEVWLRRRDGRDAALLIVGELLETLRRISYQLDKDLKWRSSATWRPLEAAPLQTQVSRSQAVALNRIIEVGAYLKLSEAHNDIELANASVASAVVIKNLHSELRQQGRDEDYLAESRQATDQDVARAVNAAREAAESAIREIAPLADLRGPELIVLRLGRSRARRRFTSAIDQSEEAEQVESVPA